MDVSTTQLTVGFVLVLALGFTLYVVDRRRWRLRLERQFVYGVPWGTAVTVCVLLAFYLVAQHGVEHWDEPVIYPYVSWSYFYPTGILTAGIAHGSPGHLVSNVAATIVFGIIAEYSWGHYPPSVRARYRDESPGAGPSGAGPIGSDRDARSRGRPSDGRSRAWVRAVVIFPATLLVIALLTAIFSLGPGLGFSGAVYAIVGFTLVIAPRLAVGGVVATAALGILYDALTRPIVTATIESGPPSPPSWAGVGFHAHLLGFLLGVLCAIALLRHRTRRPAGSVIFGALVLVGLVQSLWLLVWSNQADTYTLYRGAGVALLFGLAAITTVAATGSDSRLPRPLSGRSWAPSRRQLATIWIGTITVLLGLFAGGAIVAGEADGFGLGAFLVAYLLLVAPAVPPFLPARLTGGPLGYRQGAVLVLCVLTALVALVSVPYGFVLVDGEPSGSGGVALDDYVVTYEENATVDRSMLGFPESETEATYDGLLVTSDGRELFAVGERASVIAHEGEATVAVGGPGWYQSVHAERSGWNVLGNETAYVVDLTVDGETTRSYTSDAVETGAQFGDTRIVLAPTDDRFELRFTRDGEITDAVPVPEPDNSRSIGSFVVRTESVDGVDRLVVSRDGVTVAIAERETY